MKKRIVALLMVVCLVLGMVPTAARADDGVLSGQCGDNVSWTYNQGTKVLTIEGNGKIKDLDTWDDSDGNYLFNPYSSEVFNAEYIVIREGVTHVGDLAFKYCRNVKSVELPSSLGSIGYSAFSPVCPWYREIVDRNTDVIINDILFYTPRTGDIVIEKPLTSVAGGAIKNAESVYFGETVAIISDGAVAGSNLKSITVLNPSCEFAYTVAPTTICGYYGESASSDVAWDILPGLTVYGYPNSTAQEYCEKVNNFWCWKDFLADDPWKFITLKRECPFEDVTSSDYYYEPVLWAVDEGITDGVTETEFAPEDTCKRSQVVTFLWRAAGEPKAASRNNPFVDVKSTDYFYEAVLWAVEKGITDGMDETHFEPDGVCNRSQVVTFLYRTFGEPPVGSAANPFTDVPSHKWYATPVLWAVKEGITDGVTETSFAPEKPCTRAQVVTFLYRAYVD